MKINKKGETKERKKQNEKKILAKDFPKQMRNAPSQNKVLQTLNKINPREITPRNIRHN